MKWTDDDGRGMGYQCFSVNPLAPLNRETEIRIAQLRADLAWVENRSVLDIGCYAGLASIISLEKGASSVLATDVTEKYFSHLRSWAQLTNVPLEVEKLDFKSLGSKHAKDVVLFFEVYHWLAHQGLAPMVVAQKLNELARHFIIIESPFDARDPSIVRALGVDAHRYRLDLVLDGLKRMGWDIEFSGLTEYFPGEYNRARFLATRNLLATVS